MPARRSTPRCSAFQLGKLALVVLAFGMASAWQGRASARTVVEVGRGAEQHVDAALVRRLVSLELGDVEVPPPWGAQTHSEAPGLYVRIIAEPHKPDSQKPDGQRLTVELWDRGELQGVRRLSLEGSAALRARRIALVSALLARQLRERRLSEAQVERRREARERHKRAEPQPLRIAAQPFMAAAARAGYASLGNGVFFGPRVSGGLRFQGGAEIALGVGLLAGQLHGVTETPTVEWFEFAVRPGYAIALARGHALRLGASAAASALHVTDSMLAEVNASETWSATAAAEVAYRFALTRRVELEAGAELGAALRRVPLREGEEFGGAWAGLAIGANFH